MKLYQIKTDDLKQDFRTYKSFKMTKEFNDRVLEMRTKIAFGIMMQDIIERNRDIKPLTKNPEYDRIIKMTKGVKN